MFGYASIVTILLAVFLDFPLVSTSSMENEGYLALLRHVFGSSLRQLLGLIPMSTYVWDFFQVLESERARKRLKPDKNFTSTLRVSSKSSLDPEEECPICKAKFSNLGQELTALELPCGHLWCKTCIKEFVVEQRRIADCLFCKQPILYQSLRSKIVRLQMAFASTVWSLLMWRCSTLLSFALEKLLRSEATSFFTDPLQLGESTIGSSEMELYYALDFINAVVDLLIAALSWALTWWTTSRNGKNCGIVGTTQRILLPVLHFMLSLLVYDSTIKHPTQPATLMDLRIGHLILMVVPWVVHGLALMDGTWVVSTLRMEDQRWFKRLVDILL